MNKFFSYLGLAQRAGVVVSGEQAVQGGMRRGKIRLLLIANDTSANTSSKFKALAQNHDITYCVYGEKSVLGQAIGKSPRAVVGIMDQNFANVIQAQIRESVQEKI